jgi:hypothetical protein
MIFTFIFGLVRSFQSLFFVFVCFNMERGIVDENLLMDIYMCISCLALAPYFASFSCIVFQWAEVIKQSEMDVNGFINTKSSYKFHFFVVHFFTTTLLFLSGGLYFFESGGPDIARCVFFAVLAFIGLLLLIVMIVIGSKVFAILRRQWVVPSAQDLHVMHVSSQQDRNKLVKWMLALTFMLCIASFVHFVVASVFTLVAGLPFALSLLTWAGCELVPAFLVLLAISFRSNYVKVLNVLHSLAYGINGLN